MSTNGHIFDLVVVGGGITGAGIARDASHRGLRVALVEKKDFGSGTSSKSSKLVHGGLRYLEHGEVRLVSESVNERAIQMRRAPHLVRPVSFLFPVYKNARRGLIEVNIGLWIYDALAMFRSHKLHKTYKGKQIRTLEPALKTEGLAGAIEYSDCFTDDARLVLENVLDARTLGCDVRSYTRVTGFARDERGRVHAVQIRDELTGAESDLKTRCAVVAAGPWTDEMLGTVGESFGRKLLALTKGVHIVVDRARVPIDRAITMTTRDKRVIFCIPFGTGRTCVGTTDTFFEGNPDDVAADLADVKYLCDATNAFFPEAKLVPDDVIATWAGLRPLIAPDKTAGRASDVSREHEVFVRDSGVVVIAGGKLTTYRRMAKEAVDRAVEWLVDRGDAALEGRTIKKCRTKHRSLPGAQGIESHSMRGVQAIASRLTVHAGIDAKIADHLAQTYGMRAESVALRALADRALIERIDAELPYIWAEVDHAVEVDLARTVEDVLVRRVPVCLRSRDQGLGVAERVAARLAPRLGWDGQETSRQIAGYRDYVAVSRRYKLG